MVKHQNVLILVSHPLRMLTKQCIRRTPRILVMEKRRSPLFLVPTPSRNKDTTNSSDDESNQHFAVATIALKKKGKEVSQMDTDGECRHFDSDYFKKMPNSNINTNDLLYLSVILETNAGIKVNTWFLLDTGCTFHYGKKGVR